MLIAPEWIRTDDPCQNTMSIDIPPQAIRCTSLDEFESFLASAANRGADIAAFEVGLPKHPVAVCQSAWFERRAGFNQTRPNNQWGVVHFSGLLRGV
jgi:hypothetical protein